MSVLAVLIVAACLVLAELVALFLFAHTRCAIVVVSALYLGTVFAAALMLIRAIVEAWK